MYAKRGGYHVKRTTPTGVSRHAESEKVRGNVIEAQRDFCERHGTNITVINGESFSPEEELVRDLLAIVTVFSARLHGLRSHKNAIRAAALGKDIQDDQSAQDQAPSHAFAG
jgi:predicted site-specific integrase-resolvase